MVDMGGATTDVYSVHEEKNQAGTVRRGLPEAKVKRTVEGDLGMRVSSRSAAVAARKLDSSESLGPNSAFSSFVDRVSRAPETLASSGEERRFDAVLAGANFTYSVMRHSGRAHEVCTAEGLVTVQLGRDLTQVPQIIGTGGYLSATADFRPRDSLSSLGADEYGKRVLAPLRARYLRDPEYLLPLLANVAAAHPKAAVDAGIAALVEEK
nr:glutamate mutase L [Mesorhizobium mediterraneum]